MVFHYNNTFSLVAGANTTVVSPLMAPRFLTEADCWEWYRVKSLKFRIFALTTAAYAGYVEGKPDTLPSSGAQIMELLDSVTHLGPQETGWSRWVNVPKKALAGALPWYKTIVGLASDEEEVSGVLCFAGTGTNVINSEFYITVDFKGPIASANTPAMVEVSMRLHEMRRRAAAERKRNALLAAIAPAGTSPGRL